MSDRPIDRAPCEADAPLRLGVLVSGSGLMLQALSEACEQGALNASIEVVISNRKDALALERARSAGLTTRVVPHDAFDTSEAFDAALVDALDARDVELVCLAGFVPMPTAAFLEAFPLRILGAHASLLPAFPGPHPIRDALDAGVRITGCTLSFVDPGTERGRLLLQSALRVWPGDDEESLGVRMVVLQQRMLVAAVRLIADGRVSVEGHKVLIEDGGNQDLSLEWLRPDEPAS